MIPFERGPQDGEARGERPSLEDGWGGRLGGAGQRTQPALGARASFGGWRGWLVGPLMLAAAATGVLFVLRGPDGLFAACFSILVGLGMLWILASVLLPGTVERTCPSCGQDGLQRLDRASTVGLACALCGWRDESASSFLLAEEEGPLEDIVLRERRGARRRW